MARFSGQLLTYAVPVGCVLLLALAAYFLLTDRPGKTSRPAAAMLEVLTGEELAPVLRDIAAAFQRRTGIQVAVEVYQPPADSDDLFARAQLVVASAQDLPRATVAPETATATPWSPSLENGDRFPPLFIWLARPASAEGPATRFAEFLEENFAKDRLRAFLSLPHPLQFSHGL